MQMMIAGIRRAPDIVSQPAMAQWAGQELYPGTDAQTDAEIEDYVVRTHNTVYHPVGTVPMGANNDPESPLDPKLRVKDVSGLCVVDASAMPKITSANPNITVMMMGEHCAELTKSNV